jgi:hypothetical protein
MKNNNPNPWDFSNIDKNLISPDGHFRVEFYNLNEIAMGGPIGGECYLISPTDDRIKLNDWCGGPIIWDDSSRKLALPIWTLNREQKIAIVDIENNTITIYSRLFRVLDLRTFDKNIITGYDSPIHKTSNVEFYILKEKAESVAELK